MWCTVDVLFHITSRIQDDETPGQACRLPTTSSLTIGFGLSGRAAAVTMLRRIGSTPYELLRNNSEVAMQGKTDGAAGLRALP
jgi:hypothetical protein